MTVTAQTNTTLQAIAETLKTRDGFAICGHVSPDGDCVGSQLALAHALKKLGKSVVCLFAQASSAPGTLAFLPGFDEIIAASDHQASVSTFIAVDVPNRERMGDAATAYDAAEFRITIDHHASDSCDSELAYIDPDAAATCMLIWELIGYLGCGCDEDIATCAFTGLVTDTGRFQFQNTNEDVFSAAAEMVHAGADPARISEAVYQQNTLSALALERIMLEHLIFDEAHGFALSWVSADDMESVGAVRADAENLINTLRSLRGISVACMLRGESECVRGSLRSKDATDVARIARSFGGGGHVAAAGFTLHEPIEDAVETMLSTLRAELS